MILMPTSICQSELNSKNKISAEAILRAEGLNIYLPRFSSHETNFFVDQQLMTSSFVSPARLAVATP